MGNMAGVLDWIAAGEIDVTGLYHTDSPADAQKVYDDTANRRLPALGTLFDWSRLEDS